MYYLLIAFILFLYYKWRPENTCQDVDKQERLYCFIICLVLVILAAFRSDEGMADTEGYRIDYEMLPQYPSIASLIDRYGLYYIGYFGLSKAFSIVGLPVWVWFGFLEAIYLYALMKFIDKYSKDKIFSLLIFTTIGLFSFSLAGLKQTLSMSFMMFSFLLFIDKKYIPSIVFIILSYFTHQSALIFLGAFISYLVKDKKLFVPMVLIVCVLINLYSFFFMESMVAMLKNEKWEEYLIVDSSYTYVTFIFYIVISIIALKGYRNYCIVDSGNAKFTLCMSLLAAALQLLARLSPSLFRLALLYSPFFMILLPNSCFYATDNIRRPLKIVLMGCPIFYFLYSSREISYSFISF